MTSSECRHRAQSPSQWPELRRGRAAWHVCYQKRRDRPLWHNVAQEDSMTAVPEWRTAGPDIYHALTAQTSDLVAILEADGTFRYASPSFQRILGYSPAD